MPEPYHLDTDAIAQATQALAILREHAASLRFGSIITADGFEVANTLSHAGAGIANNRMAAMVSSMQALSDAITRDLAMGDSDYSIVAAPKGYVIQMRVPDHPLVLAASFDAQETVGKALSISRMAARRMGEMLLRAGDETQGMQDA